MSMDRLFATCYNSFLYILLEILLFLIILIRKRGFSDLESNIIKVVNEENRKIANVEATHIEWERIFLNIDVTVEYNVKEEEGKPLDFYAVNGLNSAKAIYEKVEIGKNQYRLRINITNTGENRCVPLGTYRIAVCQGNRQIATVNASNRIVKGMSDYSRIFPYEGRKKSYNVFFYVAEEENVLPLMMYVMASSRTGMEFPSGKRPSWPHPVRSFRKFLSNQHKPLLRRLYRFWSWVYRRKENGVLFMSEQSYTCGANQTAVYKRMQERGLDQSYDVYFSARAAASEEQSYKSWMQVIRKMAKCRMIFIDDHAPVLDWLKLNPRTKLIQLWHAGAGFKSSGYSRWGHIGCPAPQSCHRQYQYGIAGSKQIAPFFSEVWGITDEQVLPTGMPRMDEYLDENHRKEITKRLYEIYPICQGKKVILFAPTYRGKNRKTAHYPYHLIDFSRFYELCGSEYVVLFKMHPWVHDSVPIPAQYQDRFLDVGKYPNINDLFYITDLLITDYSSNIFEYSLMKKPMMFFAYDEIQYSFSRGFHRDYELAAPGKICHSFEELMTAFEQKDFEYEKVEEYVEKHFDYIDTKASDRVIDWILLGNLPQDIQSALDRRKEQNEYVSRLLFEEPVDDELEED